MAGTRIGVEIIGPTNELYRLTDYLGQGSFGEVYLAAGLSSGCVVAVKLVPVESMDNPDALTALLNEIKIASQIAHPNVVQILHVSTSLSAIGPYLVMEFASGGTLARLLDVQKATNTAIPLPRARTMIIDIAQGARAINERLIHRDIKPDNILIDGQHLKISDFGISKFIDEATRTRTFKGGQHIYYMAPEGWEVQTNTFKLDVYSVGLVCHQILTLKHPLREFVTDVSDWREWRKAHLFATCPDVRRLRPEVSPAIAQLISRMVSKRPQDRPNWEETISILGSAEDSLQQPNPLAPAVEVAVNRKQQLEVERLASEQLWESEAKAHELYKHSCGELIDLFDHLVEQFNSQYQFGKIVKRSGPGGLHYLLPDDGRISFSFLPHRESGTYIGNGQLIGGAYITVERSISANALLVRESADDLYGRWIGCFLRLAVLANPEKVIGTRGITANTVQPFGLRYERDFYDDMRWAERGMHVFDYELRPDTEKFLLDILETALKGPPHAG